MVQNKEIDEPVATVVPAQAAEADVRLVTVQTQVSIETAPATTTAVVSDARTQLLQQLRRTIPDWTDGYFSSRRSDVWAVFDLDSETMISISGRIHLLLFFIFLAFYFTSWDTPFLWLLLAIFLYWNAHQASVGKHRSYHLALTREGVLFVQERHRTWYGMKGRTEILVPYEDIKMIEPNYASGNMVLCFDCSIHRIQLWENHYHRCCGSKGVILDLRGIKEAKVFVDVVQKISSAEVRGERRRHNSTPVPIAEVSASQPLLEDREEIYCSLI